MRSSGVVVLLLLLATPAIAAPDPMAEYRERFKAGLARYQAGATAEAIQYWEPIYRELGVERGWRLAFNLARAYDTIGDVTRAVERYEAFLRQVERRAGELGEKPDELIVREEKDARARLAEIAATKARIVIGSGTAPIAVQIDGGESRLAGFTAYVAPGNHTVVFDPGSPRETKTVLELQAGEAKALSPPPAATATPDAMPPPPPTPAPQPPAVQPPPPPPPQTRKVVERPFPAPVLWIAGGAAVVSTLVPILTYQSALDYRDQNSGTVPDAQARNARSDDYDSRRTTAYATLAIPITLAVGTGALAAWYFLGGREREVPIVVVTAEGASAGIRRTF
jgi:hypothetical protein